MIGKRILTSARLSLRWPRKLIYPAAGLLLALFLPVGLLMLQSSARRSAPTWEWIVSEIRAQPMFYGYLLASTLIMLGLLGWILGRNEDRLEQMTATDSLTGLANRRRMRAQFNEELSRGTRYGTPLALLLIDVDHLKEINDEHGHAAGDRALQMVAESLRRTCRASDLAARHGGDEFMVLAVNTTATEALALAHRIRSNIRRIDVAKRGDPRRLSVSVGAADLERAAAPSFEALHAAADQALYQAKAEGRDRAVIAPAHDAAGPRLTLVPPEPSESAAADGQATKPTALDQWQS